MSTFLKSDANILNPIATIPYLEKDYAIVRGVTKCLIDVSNPESFSGTGNIAAGTAFKNLVNNGVAATLTGTSASLPPISRGMLKMLGATGTPAITFPAEASFGTAVKRSLVNFYFAFNGAGLSATQNSSLAGDGTGIGASLKWVVYLVTDASGIASYLRFRVQGTTGARDCDLAGAALTALLDGNAHQLGFAADIKDGTVYLSIYVDGVLKASATGAMVEYNQVAGTLPTFLFGPTSGGIATRGVNAFLGRPAMHDLTNRPDLTFEALLARDRLAAQGYIS